MIREYIQGHKFNQTTQSELTFPPRRKMWFVKGAIMVDGAPQAFAAWDYNRGEAEARFQTFLNLECVCTHPANPQGFNPRCPIHFKEA